METGGVHGRGCGLPGEEEEEEAPGGIPALSGDPWRTEVWGQNAGGGVCPVMLAVAPLRATLPTTAQLHHWASVTSSVSCGGCGAWQIWEALVVRVMPITQLRLSLEGTAGPPPLSLAGQAPGSVRELA